MRIKHFAPAVVKAIWEHIRKYGYVCYYTGMPLDLENRKSPLYLLFDHWIPGDPSKVVICANVVNEMKSDIPITPPGGVMATIPFYLEQSAVAVVD